jgi:serine/threonine protein kinase
MRSSASQFSVSHTYAVREILFSRGMARSYLAHDEQLDDEVVIEHVQRPLGEDTDWLRQYRSVAVKVMRLRHPNLIAIRDFSTDYTTEFFLVKQYDPGITLDVLLKPGRIDELSVDRRVGLCKDLLRGLGVLHASGVIHRDIKPYGVYVSQGEDWRAQIDHYHLAVSASGVYLDEQLCGTPVYMAPELISSEPRRYTQQSDVYAAGLVTLEILSGKSVQELLKLEGVDLVGGPMALLSDVCARGGHVRGATVRELLPGAYAEAVCCAVHPDPRERFADASCFFESFVLNAPLRVARHADVESPEALSAYLERLPDCPVRTDLLSVYRIADIDGAMALTKCRQIAEVVARERYQALIGEPRSKPLVNLVDELANRSALPPEIFTHFYHVRRHGNAAVHGSGAPGASGAEVVFTILGATVKLVTWHLLSDRQ